MPSGAGATHLLAGLAFSAGLMLVMVTGAHLFTGHAMLSLPRAQGRVTPGTRLLLGALLRQQGLDTYIGGVEAYSTLGWFDDPILSSMLRWDDDQVAATIFHELAHQQLYLPGDTAFNESYATFVEREGLRRDLAPELAFDATAALAAVRDHDGGRTVTALHYSGHPTATKVLAEVVAEVVGALRDDELIASLWREQRDFMAPYVFERLGTSQQGALAILSDMLSQAQERRHVRAGDAKRMAAMVLLIASLVAFMLEVRVSLRAIHVRAELLR